MPLTHIPHPWVIDFSNSVLVEWEGVTPPLSTRKNSLGKSCKLQAFVHSYLI